ncbi:MAG: BatA domain-containing protein [Gemmataceae bacterium]|nr:BatA domain-containing protein [Gemmataceae bacterium]
MHPILLVGVALVGLPILLHLIMKQEPKRLPFPAFRFLRQRLKTNQRKLRLRHFLLLALRMLLIALFALTLYQPTVLSDGLINLSGSQPLAVVVVVDTSPSMGYADGRESRLEDAARRALELVNDLADGSRVAVVETGDPGGDWLPSVSDARSRLEGLIKRAQTGAVGGTQPVTAGLAAAYQLLKTVDAESDGAEPLPRLVAVFTDRAAASWDPARVEDLKKLRDAVPDPKPTHVVVDVGADRPVNVALTGAEMADGRSQVVPANQPAGVSVTVAATGLAAPATVRAYLDDAREPQTKDVAVPDGQSRAVAFEFRDLKPGLHQVRFELETKDALPADNTRYFTFRTAEPRRVLTIADRPDEAAFWKLALDAKGEFAAEVVTPDRVAVANGRPVVTLPDPADGAKSKTDDLSAFEAVVLFEVGRPGGLWDALRAYVEGGGKLVVVPPPPGRAALDEYNGEAAVALMPGALKRVVTAADEFPRPKAPKGKDRSGGVVWSVFVEDDDRAAQHPLLAPIREAKRAGNVDFVVNPRRVTRYWEVEPRADGQVVARYDDADDPANRRPAVLERSVIDAKDKTPRGRVLLLTTRLHVPSTADPEWNEYWYTSPANSWVVQFPEMLMRAAAGSTADANFNYLTGQTVAVPLTRLLAGKRENLALDGPGVTLDEAVIRPAERQTELRLGPPRTNTPGNFTLSGPAADWKEGFSLDLPADESNLSKVPAEGIEDLTGAGSVVPVGKDVKLADVLTGTEQFKTPVDLFPWLLIGVLMLLVGEAFLANRFYRVRK